MRNILFKARPLLRKLGKGYAFAHSFAVARYARETAIKMGLPAKK
jgi:HD-GYP domain-containing protein (c-di-GMP phosphodiesterase class II)